MAEKKHEKKKKLTKKSLGIWPDKKRMMYERKENVNVYTLKKVGDKREKRQR